MSVLDDPIMRLPRPQDVAHMDTQTIRDSFLIPSLFAEGQLRRVFTDMDRMVAAGAQPKVGTPLEFTNHRETGTEFFLQRRELGVLNVGGTGRVVTDGITHTLENLDCLYVSMGTKSIVFHSDDPTRPAQFYLLSCPAHQVYPTSLITRKQCTPRALGAKASANERKIYQYIHAGGLKSCQLVMGFTELAEGSVWNTMPPHTHARRTEVYFYFDCGPNVVIHLMGQPQATRHLIIHDRQAVLSPAWSIHCACGIAAYRFCWGMAGENQTFDDMDPAPLADLR